MLQNEFSTTFFSARAFFLISLYVMVNNSLEM